MTIEHIQKLRAPVFAKRELFASREEQAELWTAAAYYSDLTDKRRDRLNGALAPAGLKTLVHAILIDGRDLVHVGRELSGYSTDQQARAFAIGQLLVALKLISWASESGKRHFL